jgi:hypothetical protein
MLRSPLVWRTASLDQIVIEMSAESPDTQNQEHDASADLQHLEKQRAVGSRQYRCHGLKPVAVGNKKLMTDQPKGAIVSRRTNLVPALNKAAA